MVDNAIYAFYNKQQKVNLDQVVSLWGRHIQHTTRDAPSGNGNSNYIVSHVKLFVLIQFIKI